MHIGMDSDNSYGLDTPEKKHPDSQHIPQSSTLELSYMTSINELIAEPDRPSATEYFLATLYRLSDYLFQKKINQEGNDKEEEISFDEYLNSFSNQITAYDISHKRSKQALAEKIFKSEESIHESELLQCYERVPYIFFQDKFVLDFGDLRKNPKQIRQKQEQMNDDLDLVEINLFSQIHYKFHEYFKVVANFDYLGQSLAINISKIQEARSRVNIVQEQFLNKSVTLRKKIIHRQNLEKTIKLLKIVKSLKKLPIIMKQILQSSLPYQCLALLKSTKESLGQAEGLQCLNKTSQNIKESESLVQMGLNKRYADQLYLYLQQCQKVSLQENWDRINSHGCMDISMNNSCLGGTSAILEQSFLEMQPSGSKNKRNQGKEFQIAMILLQSYRYIDFPVDLTRIKISNSLRVFSKRFDQELALCLKEVLELKKQKMIAEGDGQEGVAEKIQISKEEDNNLNEELVQKITVIFYVKHLYSFNEIMKDTMDRFLGYLHTLFSEYQESQHKNQAKFLQLFKQELTILPAMSKIIIEKLKALMQLKNINGIGLTQFKQWIGLLEYWQKYLDGLIDDNSLINYEGPIEGLQECIGQTFRRTILNFNIKPTVNELSLGFITSYHTNVLTNELEPGLIDESWQSVQIPSQFMEVLNNVAQWQQPHDNQNVSITILNQSSDKGFLQNKSQDYSAKVSNQNKFRVLKNNILIEGNRYKVSVSFLLLIECVEEYVKMGRSLYGCQKYVYERMFDLVDNYNTRTKELILDAQARKYEKIKSKNISAKHLCLLHNCISVLLKLLEQMNYPQIKELNNITMTGLANHKQKLIEKLSTLLRGKIESTINTFLTNQDSVVEKTNLSLLNVFVQMMGIIDEYLSVEDRKLVFRDSINVFITRYFKELLLKGGELLAENRLLVQKMRFLRQYFPEQLQIMQKELNRIEQQTA